MPWVAAVSTLKGAPPWGVRHRRRSGACYQVRVVVYRLRGSSPSMRSDLVRLHERCAACLLSSSSGPPLMTGMMWSTVKDSGSRCGRV